MKTTGGKVLLVLAAVAILSNYYFLENPLHVKIVFFASILSMALGIWLVIPFHLLSKIIFDILEWTENKTVPQLIKKLRLRGLLFNNIAVGIFIITVLVIITGFYLLARTPTTTGIDIATSLTIRIGASVLLIFLVQILFRVFKYLLRVAAFYNGKADALEFNQIQPELALEKVIDLFTPEKYDISDLQQLSVVDILSEIIKGKSGK